MYHRKRWTCLVLAGAMACSLALPCAASPGGGDPASISVRADQVDNVVRSLKVSRYIRNSAFEFVLDAGGDFEYESAVNRAAGNTAILIDILEDGTPVTVECLTDLNNDGRYEWLTGGDAMAAEALFPDGSLAPVSGEAPQLDAGHYEITDTVLRQAGARARVARTAAGSDQQIDIESVMPAPELYLVTCGAGERAIYHYFILYDRVIMPADVPYGEWYYYDVEYAMEKGFLNGTGPDTYTPQGIMTRAELAQVLWNLAGRLPAPDPGYADVQNTEEGWYYPAVSWCVQEQLMTGENGLFEPLRQVTREEMAKVLYLCAKYTGRDISMLDDLSAYPDAGVIAEDCLLGMQWAVAAGIITGTDQGILDCQGVLTRAQLARVLHIFLELDAA